MSGSALPLIPTVDHQQDNYQGIFDNCQAKQGIDLNG